MSPPTIAKLNDENYMEWVIAMQVLLTQKGLWNIPCEPSNMSHPAESDNTRAMKNWHKKNGLVCAELLLNIEPAQYGHTSSAYTNNIWEELRRVHQVHGFGMHMVLLCNFWHMARKPDQAMTSWIADVRCAARTLEEINAPVAEEHTILVLTNGLLNIYSQVIVSLNMTPTKDLSLEHVIKHLINEESCVSMSIATTSCNPANTALTVTIKPCTPIKRITCFKWSKKGHYQRDCPQLKENANFVEVW